MVSDAAEQLNNRPRKYLHLQTPAEVFNHVLTGALATRIHRDLTNHGDDMLSAN